MPALDFTEAVARRLGDTEVLRVYQGADLIWEPFVLPARVAIPVTDDLGTSAHSFLETATGASGAGYGGILASLWTGTIHQTYLSGSWLSDRWDANGPDRTATAYSAFVFTEFADPGAGGYADPATTQGIETLQYAYWHVLNAQDKGALMACLFWGWTPEDVSGLGLTREQADDDTMAKAEYVRQWLNARPEITIPVYVIPVSYFVTQMLPIAEQYHPEWPVFADATGHFNGTWQETDDALSWLLWMMLRAEKAPADAGRSPFLQACIDMGWSLLTQYETTGLGYGTIAPFPVASDPLPAPDPLPGGEPPVDAIFTITPDSYEGPAVTNGTLPAASGGFRRIYAADPAVVSVGPLAVSQQLYIVCTARITEMPNGGLISLFAFNDGPYGWWPGLWVQASGWVGRWLGLLEDGGVGTTVEGDPSLNGTWQVVEVWAEDGDISISIDGGPPVTGTSTGDGTWEVSELHIGRDESSASFFDLAASRAFADIPDETERAARRAWAAGFIPT